MPSGYLSFVLHAHLPFVRHPEYDRFLEEQWLFEAMTETYIPLIRHLRGAVEDQVPFSLTISISPSLLAMLEDELLCDRYAAWLERSVELGGREMERLAGDGHLQYLAGWYSRFFADTLALFEMYDRRLSKAFAALAKSGHVELITTAATHGFLPLLASRRKAVENQLRIGIDYFESVFDFRPKGLWLPECAYFPGLDAYLADEGIRYFVTESHGIEQASAQPVYGVHAPLFTPSGVAAFGRDQGSTKQVWSAEEGFPGHPDYREFYRDIGHDLDFNYLRDFMPGEVRADTGYKYHRITGPTPHKQAYSPERATEQAALNAEQFLRQRMAHLEFLAGAMETPPIITAPFDAELFGHWWFEGPQWLDFLIRKAAFDQDQLELVLPSQYLDANPVHQVASPLTSTWGHQGYFETWLNSRVDWMLDDVHSCCQRLERLATRFASKANAMQERLLNQAVRELLLAQSSDWPFIVSNGTSVEYAERRVRDHVCRFHWLANAVEDPETLELSKLEAIETMDNCFPKVDFRHYGLRA